jgi:hypothetical protein
MLSRALCLLSLAYARAALAGTLLAFFHLQAWAKVVPKTLIFAAALTLPDINGNVVQSNNNCKNTRQAAIEATGLAPPNNLDAAILAPVAPRNYTAILSGNGGGTGIGLLEVYN